MREMKRSTIPVMGEGTDGPGGNARKFSVDMLLVAAGAVLAAASMELFLVPHQLLIGGATGLSMIISYGIEIPLGIMILLLNLPFLYWNVQKGHLRKPMLGIGGWLVFGLTTLLMHPIPGLAEGQLAAAIFGGAALGVGIGLVIRCGAFLDSLSWLDTSEQKKPQLQMRLLIIMIHVVIILAAVSLYALEQVLYSILATAVVWLTVQRLLGSASFEQALYIKTSHVEEVIQAVAESSGNASTRVPAGIRDREGASVLRYDLSRLEIVAVSEAAKSVDPNAVIRVWRNESRAFRL